MTDLRCPYCGEGYVRKIAHRLMDGMWAGRPAFILGGGPSLTAHGSLYDIPDHGYVVATNRAIELPVQIDLWTWMEVSVFHWVVSGYMSEAAQRRFLVYDGIYVARKSKSPDIDYPYYVTQVEPGAGLDLGQGFGSFINAHTNVGFFALNLAFCLGADPIILLGFDQKGGADGHNEWWHDGYPKKTRKIDATYDIMRRGFENAAQQAEQVGRSIWLVGPSTLTCFKRFPTLDEVLVILRDRSSCGGVKATITMEG